MKKFQKWLPGLLIFAVLLASLAGGAVYAKYVMDAKLNGSITIQANLGTIALQESLAKRNADGSYILNKNNKVTSNTYEIIPGLDIPKDPYVTITNKSPIPVYVYIEVVDTIKPSDKGVITYSIDTVHWKKLEGATGKNGGTVYVYTMGGSVAAKVTGNIGSINVLAGEKVYVSQKLKQITSGVTISFYATMRQVVDGKTPAEIYLSTDY